MNDNLKKFINVWNIVSIILLIVSSIAFGAWLYGIIDMTRMTIVMAGIAMMQATLVIIRMLSIRNRIKNGDYSWVESGVIIPRSTLSNVNVKGGEYIVKENINFINKY